MLYNRIFFSQKDKFYTSILYGFLIRQQIFLIFNGPNIFNRCNMKIIDGTFRWTISYKIILLLGIYKIFTNKSMSKEIRIQKKICGFISRLCGLEYSLKPPKDMLQWKVTTHLNQNYLRLNIRQKLYITE